MLRDEPGAHPLKLADHRGQVGCGFVADRDFHCAGADVERGYGKDPVDSHVQPLARAAEIGIRHERRPEDVVEHQRLGLCHPFHANHLGVSDHANGHRKRRQIDLVGDEPVLRDEPQTPAAALGPELLIPPPGGAGGSCHLVTIGGT